MKLVLSVIVLGACGGMRVETFSQPTTVRLSVRCDAVLEQHVGAGEYRPLVVESATAVVDVPAMGGGYTQRGNDISNVHDPNTYGVVRLRRADRVLGEMSLNDLRAAPKDNDGRSIIGC